jgi:hypothetical protein
MYIKGIMQKINSFMGKVLLSPIHPWLFASYYIFRMYAINIHDIPFHVFLRPFLVSIFMSILMFFVFNIFVKQKHISALMTSAFLFMFFLYYPIVSILPIPKTYTWIIWISISYAILTVIIILWISRRKISEVNINVIAGVNLMAVILILFPTMQSLRYIIANQQSFTPKVSHVVESVKLEITPDIYYIILDAYPRADVLAIYGYDNSEFINALEELGFYVAECSQSNYSNTAPSLASSLNMDYLQTLSNDVQAESGDFLPLFKMLDENAVRVSLSNLEYKTVSFASGFLWAEWRDADVFISPPEGPMTEFETVVLFSTYARILHDLKYVNLTDIHAERFRTRTRLVLNNFDMLAHESGPKFVFIHLIVPHAPFSFDENGNPVDPNQFHGHDGYITQVKFINKFILPKLKKLISESETPPIIILQGDHGPIDKNLQMRILNAYYLPKGKEKLYPNISPVNTFRIMFNAYFETSFPLLEDVSYYSDGGIYNFKVMPNTCPQQ